jgi:hypothetical protein
MLATLNQAQRGAVKRTKRKKQIKTIQDTYELLNVLLGLIFSPGRQRF